MKKRALLLCLCFLTCCSRAGENPLPIAPVQPRSEYDLEAAEFSIKLTDRGTPHQSRIKVGTDVWVFRKICNVGLQSIHRRFYTQSVEVNGEIVRPHYFGEYSTLGPPLVPGGCQKGFISVPGATEWQFRPEEPGRYEFKLIVHLSPRLEEDNKANNELVVVVEVVQ